jgi:hypothetical protein
MKVRGRFLILALSLASTVPLLASATETNAGVVPYERVRLWMLPPADALGNNACLTNRWHSTPLKALDWKATCGSMGSELIRFRALGANIDSEYDGTFWAAMTGRTSNLTPYWCDGGLVREGRVHVWGYDAMLKGHVVYAHTILYASVQFNINILDGGSLTNARLTSVGIGDTTRDAPAGVFTDCWKGWHVHENNSTGSYSYWDSWHYSLYDTAPINCDCYDNDDDANWSRRMTWQITNGG